MKLKYTFGWGDPRKWSFTELLMYWYTGKLPK